MPTVTTLCQLWKLKFFSLWSLRSQTNKANKKALLGLNQRRLWQHCASSENFALSENWELFPPCSHTRNADRDNIVNTEGPLKSSLSEKLRMKGRRIYLLTASWLPTLSDNTSNKQLIFSLAIIFSFYIWNWWKTTNKSNSSSVERIVWLSNNSLPRNHSPHISSLPNALLLFLSHFTFPHLKHTKMV